VPAKVTYQHWFDRQSTAFQSDVLGKTKARLFCKGELPFNRFVNRAGDQLLLRQLVIRNKNAFVKAGLDPGDFL